MGDDPNVARSIGRVRRGRIRRRALSPLKASKSRPGIRGAGKVQRSTRPAYALQPIAAPTKSSRALGVKARATQPVGKPRTMPLPPGIAKQVASGRALPPGLAKKAAGARSARSLAPGRLNEPAKPAAPKSKRALKVGKGLGRGQG